MVQQNSLKPEQDNRAIATLSYMCHRDICKPPGGVSQMYSCPLQRYCTSYRNILYSMKCAVCMKYDSIPAKPLKNYKYNTHMSQNAIGEEINFSKLPKVLQCT